MTQDDKPAPAVVDEETAVTQYVPPSPPQPTQPKPTPKAQTGAPDPFAVGVRVLKMAPAWLLVTTLCCTLLVLLLGWMRPAGDAAAVTLPSKRNDARAVKRLPAADDLRAEASAPASQAAPPVNVPGKAAPAANEAPALAAAQATAPPTPSAQTAQPAPPAPAKAEERVQGGDSGAKFTAQVGSHKDQSEANEQVSRLRSAGFDARSAVVELPGRGTWYRVQVGRFADRGEATKVIATLRAKGAAAAAIVVPLQN